MEDHVAGQRTRTLTKLERTMANIKITLQDYTANVRLNSNRIQLRLGMACGFSRASCADIEDGHTFWNSVPTDSCKFSEYSALYQGYADKIIQAIQLKLSIH